MSKHNDISERNIINVLCHRFEGNISTHHLKRFSVSDYKSSSYNYFFPLRVCDNIALPYDSINMKLSGHYDAFWLLKTIMAAGQFRAPIFYLILPVSSSPVQFVTLFWPFYGLMSADIVIFSVVSQYWALIKQFCKLFSSIGNLRTFPWSETRTRLDFLHASI